VSKDSSDEFDTTLNIFSLASGHLYERFLRHVSFLYEAVVVAAGVASFKKTFASWDAQNARHVDHCDRRSRAFVSLSVVQLYVTSLCKRG